MKLSRWTETSLDNLKANGFGKLKPHEFVRTQNGIVQLLSVQRQKGDIHIWFNVLPLSLPELWLNMGWCNGSGRIPGQENRWNVDAGDEPDIRRIQRGLRDALIEEGLPRLNRLATLSALYEALDENFLPFAAWPKAFCMFQIGRIEKGKEHLESVLADPLQKSQHVIARTYLDATANEILDLITEQMTTNIKKNRLEHSRNDD